MILHSNFFFNYLLVLENAVSDWEAVLKNAVSDWEADSFSLAFSEDHKFINFHRPHCLLLSRPSKAYPIFHKLSKTMRTL